MNVSLTPELEKFITQQVDSGMYQTASEVVRAGLRKLKSERPERISQMPTTLAELEDQLRKSIASLDRGEGIDGAVMFRQLRQEIRSVRRRGTT